MLSIPLGWLADKVDRTRLLIIESIVLMAGFGVLLWPGFPLWGVFGLIGLAYAALPSVIWSSLKDCVDKSHLGFANGLMTSIQNAGIALILLTIGGSYDHFHSYNNRESHWQTNTLLFLSTVICFGAAIFYGRARSTEAMVPESMTTAIM
jgi:MFS family permease